ncbi:MAG: GIY-YIG nuclease family protein [Candidatus Omnitrophota bacterium]
MGIREKIRKLPQGSGVYIMKSKAGKVFYVGKASSLRKRVSTYFLRSRDPKTDSLIKNIVDIDYIECDTPEQALVLEAALIKEKKPKYNVALRDNKSYPYVVVTKDKFSRIFISRPKGKIKGFVFGPYTQAKTLKSALALMRKIFPYRSCRKMSKSACLFFHLKLCPAPCLRKISLRDYRAGMRSICKILNGERRELAKELTVKMKKLAAGKKFEEAASLRDKLSAIDNLYQGKPRAHEIIALKEALGLTHLPLYIEAIDISSLGKSDSVGSVVAFKDGVPDKSNYRRFRIKTANKRDDYGMITEVVRRRYSRLIREKRTLPDLIIIDGGKGHLLRAHKELAILEISLPLISIAKRNEEIWMPPAQTPLPIARDNPGLYLIQRVRDEAHRFAHTYGFLRRKKRTLSEDRG